MNGNSMCNKIHLVLSIITVIDASLLYILRIVPVFIPISPCTCSVKLRSVLRKVNIDVGNNDSHDMNTNSNNRSLRYFCTKGNNNGIRSFT